MDSPQSPYALLNLASDASQDEIRDAYESAIQYCSSVRNNAEHIRRLDAAYRILSDPMARTDYDRYYGVNSSIHENEQNESALRDATPESDISPVSPRPSPPRVSFEQPSGEQEKERIRREFEQRLWKPAARAKSRESSGYQKLVYHKEVVHKEILFKKPEHRHEHRAVHKPDHKSSHRDHKTDHKSDHKADHKSRHDAKNTPKDKELASGRHATVGGERHR